MSGARGRQKSGTRGGQASGTRGKQASRTRGGQASGTRGRWVSGTRGGWPEVYGRAPTVYIYKLFTGVYRVYYLGLFTAHCVSTL